MKLSCTLLIILAFVRQSVLLLEPLAPPSTEESIGDSNSTELNKFSLLQACLLFYGLNTQEQLFIRPWIKSDHVDNSTVLSYSFLNFQWNNCCGTNPKTPFAYLLVNNPHDVISGITCGRRAGLRIVPKSGGHSYGKYSFGDRNSLIIDTRKLSQVNIDSNTKTAEIGPGILSGPLLHELYTNGKFGIPVGYCPTVGINFVHGGGYSPLVRRYGMSLDSLREVELVTTNGELIVANKDNIYNDLFWAINGGGGGTFGIVTKFKFQLFDAPKLIWMKTYFYTQNDFPYLFIAWENLMKANLPRQFGFIFDVGCSTKWPIKVIVFQLEEVMTLDSTLSVEGILESYFPTPKSFTSLETLTYPEFIIWIFATYDDLLSYKLTDFDQLATIEREHETRKYYARTNSYFTSPITREKQITINELESLKELLLNRPDHVCLYFVPNDAAVNDIPINSTAYVHRGPGLYHNFLHYDGQDQNMRASTSWLVDWFAMTKAVLQHTESYQNYNDIKLQNYLERYFGSNLQRLREIKTKYDPMNILFHPQSIPPF